jgi:hypothetical protein
MMGPGRLGLRAAIGGGNLTGGITDALAGISARHNYGGQDAAGPHFDRSDIVAHGHERGCAERTGRREAASAWPYFYGDQRGRHSRAHRVSGQ